MPDDLSRADIPEYTEIIEIDGLRVPFVAQIVTPRIERPLRSGRYEAGERMFLKALLEPGDRVLDLGAGLGLVSSEAARHVPEGRVLSVEAHPLLLPLVRETWAANDVANAELRHGLVSPTAGPPATFYIRDDFWASSTEPRSYRYRETAEIARVGLDALVAEFAPTVISCDIEGGEDGLFDAADLSGVRAMVIELHPRVYGAAGAARILATLAAKGLRPRPQKRPSSVHVLERGAPAVATAPSWPPEAPRIMVATCMKDEGPFILEWLAWHRAIGVTDIVVFSNDCSDGTDRLLDRLDETGEITHLPNPASAAGSTYFQATALAFAQAMPVFRQADFFLSMDVDEFVNIRTGDGSFGALLGAVPAFDVLSICELNHGANGMETFRRGWVTELFPGHDNPHPGRWRARAGVKSLTRIGPRIAAIRNHRPDLGGAPGDAVWLDGSGRPMADLAADPAENGVDSRGRRDLVCLEHFALRSLDSYLVKMHRGDVVVEGKQVSTRYWRVRNRNESRAHDLAPGIARARAYHRRFEADARLMALHEACAAAHEARIAELRRLPVYRDRRAEILDRHWPD